MHSKPCPQPCSAFFKCWERCSAASWVSCFTLASFGPSVSAVQWAALHRPTSVHGAPPHQAFLSDSFHGGCSTCCCTPSTASPDAVNHGLTSEASLPLSAMLQSLPLRSPVRFPCLSNLGFRVVVSSCPLTFQVGPSLSEGLAMVWSA